MDTFVFVFFTKQLKKISHNNTEWWNVTYVTEHPVHDSSLKVPLFQIPPLIENTIYDSLDALRQVSGSSQVTLDSPVKGSSHKTFTKRQSSGVLFYSKVRAFLKTFINFFVRTFLPLYCSVMPSEYLEKCKWVTLKHHVFYQCMNPTCRIH